MGLVGSLVSPLLLGDLVVGVDETVVLSRISMGSFLLYVCHAVCASVCLYAAFVGFAITPAQIV